ncbi:MAG: aminopeptidase N, partial [Alphaproteobacteria bacterium]|nr:aminopeptidase N [Alphaproteobacteria bacterium]
MREAQAAAPIRRDAYTPPTHAVDTVDLTIALYQDRAVVTSRLSVRRLVDGDEPLLLKGGGGLLLEQVYVDGQVIDKSKLDPASGEISIMTGDVSLIETVSTIHPAENTALEGLYKSGEMYCTQCEPEGFRHITWHPDRPDVMSIYTTRIEADQALPVLLSNGNLVEEGKMDGGRHFAVWHDPFLKPSYLFAMVAGDLDCVKDHFTTSDGRKVDLRIYVEHGNAGRTAHAMDSLKRSMRWDEEVFGLSYDLDIFMIVAVSHFNMGAMENKGLNIFNSKFILADLETASDMDLERVEGIVAHEYFHNWTGNRITCRDWFQLTLKEGLTVYRDQEFTADMHSRGVKRADDVALLRSIQFPEDNGPTAHPIRPEEYTEINNFYTPTVYEKGAEVIRMLNVMLGADAFMKGISLYIERHDGTAATCEDFIRAIEDGSGADLSQFRNWYSQAGTPVVSISRNYDEKSASLTLTFQQILPDTSANTPRRPLVIPIRFGLVSASGKDLPLKMIAPGDAGANDTVILDTFEKSITLTDVPVDAVPSYFRGFSAPVRIETDLKTSDRITLLSGDSDSFGRWDAGQTLMTDAVLAMMESPSGQATSSLVDNLCTGLRSVFEDKRLDGAEKAQMLALPSQAIIEAAVDAPDPILIWKARRQVARQIGLSLGDIIKPFLDIRLANSDKLDAKDRSLVSRILGLAVLAEYNGIAEQAKLLSSSSNMTLSEASLHALNQGDTPQRFEAVREFGERWQNNPLVMEKWFMIESSAPMISTPEYCTQLMKHAAFDATNPNKLRSVLSVFASANPRNFHAVDGSGYTFLAKHIAKIDNRNPQIAARMVLPLTRFSRYDQERQSLMKGALTRIKTSASLSTDLS